MKKLLVTLLTVILCLVLATALVACEKGNKNKGVGDNGDNKNNDVGNDSPVSIEDIDGEAEIFTEGLNFELSSNGDSYRVTGYSGGSESVVIPSKYKGLSVQSIDASAFEDCMGITSITISDKVTYIGDNAFYNTAYYNNESNWENGVLYIGNHLIKAKETISGSYVIKNGTKTIADSAFLGCTALTSITISDSVTSIGNYAFEFCTGLTSVKITSIEAWCGISFGSVATANPLSYAHNLYLNGNLVTELVIPESVTSIGLYAFEFCTELTSVTIPESVTSIGKVSFEECTGLTSITIPDSVTSIGDYAFMYCTELTSINFTGTKAQWKAISKGYKWNYDTGEYTVHCTDGDISKADS